MPFNPDSLSIRIFPFLIVIALAIEALTCNTLIGLTMQVMTDRGDAYPLFSSLIFRTQIRGGFWALPILFSVYAFLLSLRRAPAVGAALIFAGVALICGTLLLSAVLLAQHLALFPGNGSFC
jgi:hypothetical protein